VKLDTSATSGQFSLDKPALAFPCRSQYQEYFWPGIYAFPHKETMIALEQAGRLQEAIQNLPDHVDLPPDAWE
jgi:hypothetical protein